MSGPVDLADLIFQLADPVNYHALQVELFRQRNPGRIGRAERTPDISDRMYEKAPGYVEALIQRNEDFAKDVDYGPLSGKDLDTIIMNDMLLRAKKRLLAPPQT